MKLHTLLDEVRLIVGKSCLKFSSLAAIALALAACAPFQGQQGSGLEDLADPPPFPQFVRYPAEQPVISSGSAGVPIMVFDPHVYADDEGYHLFYTTSFCRRLYSLAYTFDPAAPDYCNIVNAVGSTGYAFSSDRGLSWEFRQTPVVLPAYSGFDSAKIETAHVFRLGNTLYLSYSADGDIGGRKLEARHQIGIAKLELGRRSVREALLEENDSFKRRSRPMLAYSMEEGKLNNNVQEPSVVIRDDRVELYYIALGLKLPEEAATAPGQKITSITLGRADFGSGLAAISAPEERLATGVNITEIKYFDEMYHLFGTSLVSGEFHQGEELIYATSPDGRSWSSNQILLSPGDQPTFDNWGLMAPTAVVEEDRIIMFYTAYEVDPNPCFPIPPDGRFGRPVVGGQKCVRATLGRAVSAR